MNHETATIAKWIKDHAEEYVIISFFSKRGYRQLVKAIYSIQPRGHITHEVNGVRFDDPNLDIPALDRVLWLL